MLSQESMGELLSWLLEWTMYCVAVESLQRRLIVGRFGLFCQVRY